MLAKMAFRMALDYTRKMTGQALQAALKELAAEAGADVLTFLEAFPPEVLQAALERAEARKRARAGG
ncbi:MAG: hypothetical protein ABIJ57_01755 [Pseudomonadota bacterium]